MPKIFFVKAHLQEFTVEKGTVLMNALLEQGIPVASSCHGDGVCAKCRVRVIAGANGLSSANETEKFLVEKDSLAPDFRISCQVQVVGDVTIDTGYW